MIQYTIYLLYYFYLSFKLTLHAETSWSKYYFLLKYFALILDFNFILLTLLFLSKIFNNKSQIL